MLKHKTLFKGLILSSLMILSQITLADSMSLDEGLSKLSYVSIKNGSVAETNSIQKLTGTLSDKGDLDISIFLTSVETGIPIRNTRMNRHVFDSENNPIAKIIANVAGKIPESGVAIVETEGELTMGGVTKKVYVNAMVVNTGEQVLVSSIKPIIINAADFGMEKGIKELQDLAKLASIATAVPVNFTLVFKK